MAGKKIKLSWDALDYCTQEISERYKDTGLKIIIGISRGGLVPAVVLSHKLNIPMESLVWQTRDEIKTDVSSLLRLKLNYRKHEILFVDDICDSGKTILEIRNYFEDAMFATLIDKLSPENNLVDFSAMIYDSDKWVEFPWEK